MPKISVIVPVYNLEKYIKECLDSLVAQTFRDFEVLVINDGSTDNSQKIIDSYVKKYSFIKSLKKTNGGQSETRNLGISKTKSLYVYFLDGDDFIKSDLLEKCYNQIEKEQSDIVCFDYFEYFDENHVRCLSSLKLRKNANNKECLLMSPPAAWNKLFRRDFLVQTKILFPVGIWYEDLSTIVRLLVRTDKISFIKEPLYFYRQRPGSVMNTVSTKIFDMYRALDLIYEEFEKANMFQKYYEVLESITILNLTYVQRTLTKSDIQDRYSQQLKVIDYLNKHFKNYQNNRFLAQEKWLTRLHIQVLFHPILLKIYNIFRGGK